MYIYIYINYNNLISYPDNETTPLNKKGKGSQNKMLKENTN